MGTNNAYLSFGASNDLTSEVPAYVTVGSGAGIGNAKDVNEQYIITTSGNHKRIGLFDGTRTINGHLNEDVGSNSQGGGFVNFPAKSFGDADQGDIKLEVNGSVIVTASMTDPSVGAGGSGIGTDDSNVNGNGTGFLNLSSATTGTFSNGNSFSTFKHRTGEYSIHPSDQRNGWNYARVIHTIGSTDTTTNYIEWINDNNATATNFAGNALSFEGSGSVYLSGVEYFQSGSAEYKVRIANNYLFVHTRDAIQFPTSNAGSIKSGVSFSIANQSKPSINTGGGEDHTKVLHLTGSGNITANYLIGGSITAGVTVNHPLKSISANQGQSTASNILLYNLSNTSTSQMETFRRENFRIISGSYDTQTSLTGSSNVWDSTKHITASNGGHTNGLQFYNDLLVSPTNSLNSGDFSSLTNGPDDNPDYSGESGQRTFYRWFQNNSGKTVYDFSLDIDGSSSTIVGASDSLGTSSIRVFVKFPSNGTRETGWLDTHSEFILDSYSDNDGAHIASGHMPSSGLSFDDSLDSLVRVSLGTVGIGSNEYIGVRIEADASWNGSIANLSSSFGIGTGTPPTYTNLTQIDCDDDGTDCNLSFGNSKSITDYTNPATTYSPDGDSAFSPLADLNSLYQTATSGNNLRRSVFKKDTIIEGDINPSNSLFFADANSGSLNLEVNGSVLHTVNLTGTYNNVGAGEPGSGTGTSFTGNSGFFNLSVWRPATYSNNIPYYLEIRRSGKYRVHTDDQRDGWNYARILHSGSWGVRTTNYTEWVNDSESQNNNISSAGSAVTQFGDDDIFYLSGVKYFVNPTGSIETRISNIYKNVYSDSSSAVSLISLTNASAASIVQRGNGLTSDKTENDAASPLQTLSTSADSQDEALHVTGNIQFNQTYSLSSSFQSALSVGGSSISNRSCGGTLRFLHPFKTTHNVTQTTANMLVFSASDTSTGTNEYFDGEKFRLQSGSYPNEASVFGASNKWSSTGSLNNNVSFPTYYSGLMVYGGLLISPIAGGASGNFRNKHESSNPGIFEGPDNNVNYSSLGENTREYFRYFTNPTTNDVSRIGLTIKGDAILATQDSGHGNTGTLGANKNIYVQIKVPDSAQAVSEFMDCNLFFDSNPGESSGVETDGCFNGSQASIDSTVDSGGATNEINLGRHAVRGTANASGPDAVVLRIRAHKDWTGYLSEININWSV